MSTLVLKPIEEIVKQSSCFGVAFDSSVPECGKCDVKQQCKIRYYDSIDQDIKDTKKPMSKKQATKKATSKGAKTPSTPVKLDPNMPNFKEMTYEQLTKMANDNNLEIKDYGNDAVNRMRVIMSLKKLYTK